MGYRPQLVAATPAQAPARKASAAIARERLRSTLSRDRAATAPAGPEEPISLLEQLLYEQRPANQRGQQ